MIKDILFWALDNPVTYPPGLHNLMLVSKTISENTDFNTLLGVLESKDYQVLSTPHSLSLRSPNKVLPTSRGSVSVRGDRNQRDQ